MGDTVMSDDEVYGNEQEVREGYQYDKVFKGFVIPSHTGSLGGSAGFDPQNPEIKQNIIACEDNNMVKVAEVTSSDLSKMGDDVAKMTEDERVEHFKTLDALKKAGEGAAKAAEEAKQIQEAPKPAIPTFQQRPMLPPESMPEKVPVRETKVTEPVYVVIKGPFGKIRQPFTSVFRDGIQLVLASDHTIHPVAYELPELELGSVMELTVEVGQLVVQCIWAGISFTLPDGSVTFNVLLIQEETQVEERQLG